MNYVGTRAKDIHPTHIHSRPIHMLPYLKTYSRIVLLLKLGNIILRNSRCVVLELGD